MAGSMVQMALIFIVARSAIPDSHRCVQRKLLAIPLRACFDRHLPETHMTIGPPSGDIDLILGRFEQR
ncbi:hypothetical protein NOJ28_19055 [Neorhizobium galegae]|uniref:hypothetical protein n=1 Tax=Neorhizobium galegae TaxID=399 RepID=UPI000A6CE592|nr:hypothetical protein [Neorhizobium galegae]MCQ1767647.1 hypothetical protein [Neorhizobium galegae]MCQ1847986.1 hypothetical protein [Neorhizobium galegae]